MCNTTQKSAKHTQCAWLYYFKFPKAVSQSWYFGGFKNVSVCLVMGRAKRRVKDQVKFRTIHQEVSPIRGHP